MFSDNVLWYIIVFCPYLDAYLVCYSLYIEHYISCHSEHKDILFTYQFQSYECKENTWNRQTPRYDVRFKNQISCILTSVSFKDPYRTFYVNIISDDEQKHERSIMSSW